MSISMKSVLTEFKDDGSEFWQAEKYFINEDHIMVSYTPGTGGEWFCGFLAQHDPLVKYNSNMQAKRVNANNRWRIKASCIGEMANRYRDDYYNTKQGFNYDGSIEWYKEAVKNAIELGYRVNYRRDLQRLAGRQTITRSHEAWNECHIWPQQLRSFKVITCVNTKDKDTWPQFTSNIIKKIWLHVYDSIDDYKDELKRKLKNKNVDKKRVVNFLTHLGEPYTWYKLQYAVLWAVQDYSVDGADMAIKHKWLSEISDERIANYTVPLPVDEYKIDLLAMLRDHNYDEYKKVCDFVSCTSFNKSDFVRLADEYFLYDKKDQVSEQSLMDILGALSTHARNF